MELLTASEFKAWLLYESPCYRAMEFALGVGAAWLVLRRPELLASRIARAAAVAALLVFQWREIVGWPAIDIFTLEPILFAMIIATSINGNFVAHGLAWAPLIFLGEVSYSLYLFHGGAEALVGITGGDAPFTLLGFADFLFRVAGTDESALKGLGACRLQPVFFRQGSPTSASIRCGPTGAI